MSEMTLRDQIELAWHGSELPGLRSDVVAAVDADGGNRRWRTMFRTRPFMLMVEEWLWSRMERRP
jgi:hypothetical protein